MRPLTSLATGLALAGAIARPGQASPPHGAQEAYTARAWGADGDPRPGRSTSLGLLLRDPKGRLVRDLVVSHERELHAILVRTDLGWFEHLHPESTGVGTFQTRVEFPVDGQYVVFLDFATATSGPQVVRVPLAVGTGSQTEATLFDAGADSDRIRDVDGYTVRFEAPPEIHAGRPARLTYRVERDGGPVGDFEPYLGALAHLVVVGADAATFTHAHAIGGHAEAAGHAHASSHAGHHTHAGHDDHAAHGADEAHAGHANDATPSEPGVLAFEVELPTAGLYRAWAQFQHRGRVVTVPFTIRASSPT